MFILNIMKKVLNASLNYNNYKMFVYHSQHCIRKIDQTQNCNIFQAVFSIFMIVSRDRLTLVSWVKSSEHFLTQSSMLGADLSSE